MTGEPTLTVGSYEFRDGQWLRNGEPFEPDPPPISDDLTALLGQDFQAGWGKTITIPENSQADPFLVAEMEKARHFERIRREHEAAWTEVVRWVLAHGSISQKRRRPPWWARLAGAAITAGIVLGAVWDGLRR